MMITLEPIWQPGTQQAIFRKLLEATAYAGRIVDCTAELDGAAAELGVLAALVDQAVTFADPDGLLDERARRMLAGRAVAVSEAAFVVADGRRPPTGDFAPTLGTIYRPDLGATLLLRVAAIGTGATTLTCAGPGIQSQARVKVDGLDPAWLARRSAWVADYPCGVDLYLCAGGHVLGLPRTTQITATNGG